MSIEDEKVEVVSGQLTPIEKHVETPVKKIEIHYVRALFHRRVLANLIDFLLFIVAFLSLFMLVRYIVTSTPAYKVKEDELSRLRLDSSLYVEVNGEQQDIVTYLNSQDIAASEKYNRGYSTIEEFISFAYLKGGNELGDEILENFQNCMLDENMTFEGQQMYISDLASSLGIKRNPDCKANYQEYYNRAISPYIDEQCQGYLVSSIPGYFENTKYISNMLIFVELPISYCIGGILIYLIPTLIFRRGRKTIGKAIYKIGLVDSTTLLNPKFSKSLARFAIFFFAELLLAPFTLCIPFIISVSLMGFSKKRQGFPDYLLNLQEVDNSRERIYFSKNEIIVESMNSNKKPVDFEPISRLDK